MLPTVEKIVFEYLESERTKRTRPPSLLEGKLHANASSAGGCARAIAFRITGLEGAPLTGDSLFNFHIGNAVHDLIQTALLVKVPGAKAEVNGVIGDFITCRADLSYLAEDSKKVCCEIKTTSDFGFKLATGAKLKSNGQWNKKDQVGEGPKIEHILQVGISAKGLDAEYLAIVYARKTATKDEVVTWEWRFKIEQWETEIQAEIARLKQIVETVSEGRIPDREYQGKILDNPAITRWPCQYCDFRSPCLKLGAGEVKIT
jgi:hypothetical protein